MKLSQSTVLAKFGNLRAQLRQGEAKAFGPKPAREIIRERESLIKAISGDRSSNLRIGQLVALYRARYKPDRAWMPLGRAIAHALGYRSYTSLDSLTKAAARASKIPILLLDAVIEAGIDPTESKYAPLVDELVNVKFSGTRKNAPAFVHAAVKSFQDSRKEAAKKRRQDKSASDADTGARIARQVATCLRKASPDEKRQQAQTIVDRLAEAVRQEIPEFNISLTWMESDSMAESSGHRKKVSAPSLVHSSGKVAPIRTTPIAVAGFYKTKTAPAVRKQHNDAKADLASDPPPEPSSTDLTGEASPAALFANQRRSAGKKPPKPAREQGPGLFDHLPFPEAGNQATEPQRLGRQNERNKAG